MQKIFKTIQRFAIDHLPKRLVKVPIYIPTFQNELLKNRVALITGATSGIGFAMAETFIASGAKVIITGRSQTRIDAAISRLKVASGFVLDNRSVSDFKKRIDDCIDKFGMPDILVNNAGQIRCNPFGSTDVASFDSIMESNLRGAYFLSQEISSRWIAMGIKGNILNVGSSSSLRPGNSPYVLSKWGIRAMTLGLAKTLIGHDIVVNAIAPGPTATRLFVENESNGINWPASPSGRLATPTEIANLAVVLVSSMGRMIVGDMIFATGGCGTTTVDDI